MAFKYAALVLIALILAGAYSPEIRERIRNDETLIVPGAGAERIYLGEGVGRAIKSFEGASYTLAKRGKKQDIFMEVFSLNTEFSLAFTEIYYCKTKEVFFMSLKGVVVAVGGFNRNRVTADMVDLKKGAEYAVFRYGNEGLRVIRKAKGQAYYYRALGFAFFDDGFDDMIDLYLVFTPPVPGQ